MLDTYQAERRPHARALIRLARLVGMAMTEGGEPGNLLRRLVAPRLYLLPGVSQLVLSSETPPLRRGELVIRPRLRRSPAGRLCPNAVLDDGRRFDDVAAGRFAVVTTTDASPDQRSEVTLRGGVLVPARPGTPLHRWLRRGHATSAIVRPDGTVLRAGRDLSALCAGLPPFTPDHRHVTGDHGSIVTGLPAAVCHSAVRVAQPGVGTDAAGE
jgi:3-(3-hydroxy-phenyl)propionate hydroxylase